MIKKLLPLLFLSAIVADAVSQDYVITKYGASSDSTNLNTIAIQNVIDKAELNGGGTIVIPKGVYLTGALFFKPKTKLLLQEGAMLKGSDDISNYPLIPSRMEGRSIYYYAALINAYHVDSFSITGPGTIDGNGLHFWEYFWAYRDSMRKIGKSATNLEVHRPRMLFIWGCNNVTIQNVKLHNSGFWTTHLYQCNNVLIENCDIRSPFKPVPAPSTDGVDIDVCKKVTIRNCYISVNDDAVCIKGGKGPDARLRSENGAVEDVLVEDCDFGESHGTLTLGSECIHGNNITVRNCKVNNNNPILRLKMRPDTYQVYENILSRISRVNVEPLSVWRRGDNSLIWAEAMKSHLQQFAISLSRTLKWSAKVLVKWKVIPQILFTILFSGILPLRPKRRHSRPNIPGLKLKTLQ